MSRVGEYIDAHCLKCKLVLAHKVMYEVDGVVHKVKCRTCGAEHRYRAVGPSAQKRGPAEEGPKRKQVAAKAGAISVKSATMEWEVRHRNLDPDTPEKPYRLQDGYQVGDVIRHPVFGLGFVEKIVTSNRIEVLFREAFKSMAMNIQ
jgi:hypothetical protein